jgi:alpha-glucosidase
MNGTMAKFMANEYLYNIKQAAKYQISINTHEPIKDTGLRRTYPNWIAREGARGQEYNAWGSPPNPPEHAAILPFTRMLSGPMDFTPGTFDMGFKGLDKNSDRPQTTLAKQLALYVVLYSPIQMASDLPRNYEANLAAFQFIRDVPTDWQESKALAGEVGKYVAFARQQRDGEDWFLGALTNEKAREVALKLDFLDKSKRYQAQIYRDGKKADWENNPYDIIIEQKEVGYQDTLMLPLATSGGAAIRFKALD